MVFSHGGILCALASHIGVQSVLPNCSAVGFRVDEKEGKPDLLHFKWVYP